MQDATNVLYFHITLNAGPLNSGFVICVKN